MPERAQPYWYRIWYRWGESEEMRHASELEVAIWSKYNRRTVHHIERFDATTDEFKGYVNA